MDKLFKIQPVCTNNMCLHFDHEKQTSSWNVTKCQMFDIDPVGDKNERGFSVLDCLARKNFLIPRTNELDKFSKLNIDNKKIKTLNKPRKELYKLFYNSILEKRVVDRIEIFNIYKTMVAKGFGYVKFFNRDKNCYVFKEIEWNKSKWNLNFNMWFINTLGVLLKNGYLRVVPAINLQEID